MSQFFLDFSGESSVFRSERINLGCHDEVVSVEPPNLVCPERHRHPPPFGKDCRMMPFSLGEDTNAIRKT
jgi:hypothetical protein